MIEGTTSRKTRNAFDAAHQARAEALKAIFSGLFRRTSKGRSGAAV